MILFPLTFINNVVIIPPNSVPVLQHHEFLTVFVHMQTSEPEEPQVL